MTTTEEYVTAYLYGHEFGLSKLLRVSGITMLGMMMVLTVQDLIPEVISYGIIILPVITYAFFNFTHEFKAKQFAQELPLDAQQDIANLPRDEISQLDRINLVATLLLVVTNLLLVFGIITLPLLSSLNFVSLALVFLIVYFLLQLIMDYLKLNEYRKIRQRWEPEGYGMKVSKIFDSDRSTQSSGTDDTIEYT